MRRIYFDNGSTSFPKAPGVGEAVKDLIENGAFNINRGNYEGAYEIADQVLDTRKKLAKLFDAETSKQVIFTPGITYSLNYLIKGLLKPGDHVLITSMEHNAVMRPLIQAEKQGISYDVIWGDEEGQVEAEDFEKKINTHTRAIIVLQTSNVCGTTVPIERIGAICKKNRIYFVVDTAQSAGDIDVSIEKCNIDFLAFTGHKGLLGPQGIGGFIISAQLEEDMIPLITGGTGSQSNSFEIPEFLPDKYESGTMNLPGIIGLNAALSYLEKVNIEKLHHKKMELAEYFLDEIRDLKKIKIIGKQSLEERVALVSLNFEEKDNAEIAFLLEQEYGIMTRVGLHCSPMAHKTLKTYPEGTVRFSFGVFNTKEEIDICVRGLKNLLYL